MVSGSPTVTGYPLRSSAALVQQGTVALAEVRDMALVGQQVTLPRQSKFLDRLPPGPSARHRIHGRCSCDVVRLVIGDHFPRADRFSYPLTVGQLIDVEDGASQHGRCTEGRPHR